MNLITSVYINDQNQRRPIQVEIVKSNPKTLWVKLPDRNIIKRNRKRDLV